MQYNYLHMALIHVNLRYLQYSHVHCANTPLKFCCMSTLWNPNRATQFTIAASHHRVWVDGPMTRWCDDNGAMVRQWDGDGAMTRWRWCDRTSLHRYIVPSPSHCRTGHRVIVFAPSLHRLYKSAVRFCSIVQFMSTFRYLVYSALPKRTQKYRNFKISKKLYVIAANYSTPAPKLHDFLKEFFENLTIQHLNERSKFWIFCINLDGFNPILKAQF